jgi:hypothetical protein
MINLAVDESYAFDYLSILHLKSDLDKDNTVKKSNYFSCLLFIKGQLGDDFFNKVINSEEYKECYEANRITFDAVDKAKNDLVPASYVDRANYKRHSAKQKLQRRFFNSDLTEIKIGYEKYEEK